MLYTCFYRYIILLSSIFSGNFHDVPVCWIYCSHNVYIYFCVIGPMPIIDWKVCLFIFIILFCLHFLSAVCLHFLKVLKGTFDQQWRSRIWFGHKFWNFTKSSHRSKQSFSHEFLLTSWCFR